MPSLDDVKKMAKAITEARLIKQSLDDWFPNGRGDGRKFKVADYQVEPIFRASGVWHCIDKYSSYHEIDPDFAVEEWVPSKLKKTITLYRPIRVSMTRGHYWQKDCWHSRKENFNSYDRPGEKIVGWEERQVEVDCD